MHVYFFYLFTYPILTIIIYLTLYIVLFRYPPRLALAICGLARFILYYLVNWRALGKNVLTDILGFFNFNNKFEFEFWNLNKFNLNLSISKNVHEASVLRMNWLQFHLHISHWLAFTFNTFSACIVSRSKGKLSRAKVQSRRTKFVAYEISILQPCSFSYYRSLVLGIKRWNLHFILILISVG